MPFRELMGSSYSHLAEPMTVVSVVGLAVSAVGIVEGGSLLRERASARTGTIVVGVLLVALSAFMGALYPVGLFLLVVVALAWGTVMLLLLLPTRSSDAGHGRSAPGA